MLNGDTKNRAVDTNGVHGCHHLVARDLRRAGQRADPGTTGMVALVGVHLSVDRQHRFLPWYALRSPRLSGTVGAIRSHVIVRQQATAYKGRIDFRAPSARPCWGTRAAF